MVWLAVSISVLISPQHQRPTLAPSQKTKSFFLLQSRINYISLLTVSARLIHLSKSVSNIKTNADTMPFINQASPPSPPHPSLPPAKAVPKASWSCFLTVENQKSEPLDEISLHILAVLEYQKSKHNLDVRTLNPDSPSPISSFGFESSNSNKQSGETRSPQSSLPEPGISSIALGSLILEPPTNIMLNPRNLSGLLTENTDEHASHFM